METIPKAVTEHFLFPSALFANREPHRIQTILGSCVAVCLFDERLQQGGINHYMLPWWNGKGVPSPKYGDVAIELLVKKMQEMGSQKHNLIAKVFGGANQHTSEHSIMQIGLRNIATAETQLENLGIKIVGKNVGGTQGRKIVYQSGTGQVFMKFLEGLK